MTKRECVTWQITEDEAIKLKLTTSAIVELEQKFKCNLLGVIQSGNIPPLNVMLTIVQAAAEKFNPSIKYKNLIDMFDRYVDVSEGSQTDFLTDVLMPLFGVSGFLPKAQVDSMEETLEEAKAKMG